MNWRDNCSLVAKPKGGYSWKDDCMNETQVTKDHYYNYTTSLFDDMPGQSDNSVTHTLPTESLLEDNTGGLLLLGSARSTPSATSAAVACCLLLLLLADVRSSDNAIAL